MQTNVGLDFGTHQTKVCVERQDGVELKYEFYKFYDENGKQKFTIPSRILIDENNCLHYGYTSPKLKGKEIRYFKQAAFCSSNELTMSNKEALYYSCWYLAYIIFELEEVYGIDFSIQMGVPTDSSRLEGRKKLAVSLLVSAYILVEKVFENDKSKFLKTSMPDLIQQTKLVGYSQKDKENYGILVFPEAYACLLPQLKSRKIVSGPSVMVDIGGGTTDISFFSIQNHKSENERVIIYDFYSVDKGLNYLTAVETTSNFSKNIKPERMNSYKAAIRLYFKNLIKRLREEYDIQNQCDSIECFLDINQSRPIIYTGGGSMNKALRCGYAIFNAVSQVSSRDWNTKSVVDVNQIDSMNLYPILTTAYGLSISVIDDNIKCESFRDFYSNIRGISIDESLQNYNKRRRVEDVNFVYNQLMRKKYK